LEEELHERLQKKGENKREDERKVKKGEKKKGTYMIKKWFKQI